MLPDLSTCKIVIIGLGYVGLPLAIEFAKTTQCLRSKKKVNRKIIGFDVDTQRIKDLKNNFDKTGEISSSELEANKQIIFTSDNKDIYSSDVFIVTVPTPIDKAKRPDIKPIKNACMSIGKAIKKRNMLKETCPVIIFESTVYPGLTEEICVKIIEEFSELKFNEITSKGFVCGYSPERINPGDKVHKLTNIKKVTSGSTLEVSKYQG